MKRRFMFICAAALLLTGCGASADEASAQLFAMDTVMQLDAYGHQVKQAVSDAEETIQALEARLSRTREDSLVSVLNQNGAAQDLSAAEQALLSEALTFRDATGGAFDITIAPVMDAWGFTGDSYRVPAQDELDALLENVNSDEIRLSGSSVTLGAGQAIDLGGIAKGYTSDCVEAVFRENKIESGKISLGGNVFVLGGKPDGADWRVGIRDPQDENALAAVLTLRDAYAITSGGYERYFTENGNTYHHIIDPSTGYPADSGLLSVTVVAEANGPDFSGPGNGTMCDAFSTALFVMGEERALEFWRTGDYDFDLVLVTADGRVIITDGLSDRFEVVKDSGYTYETVS